MLWKVKKKKNSQPSRRIRIIKPGLQKNTAFVCLEFHMSCLHFFCMTLHKRLFDHISACMLIRLVS